MDYKNKTDIAEIITRFHTIAVVGASPKPQRPSYTVSEFLINKGYRVIPVTPKGGKILGEQAYPDLISIPEPVEVVDVFRRSDEVMPVVEQAIAIGAKVIWLQQGVINEEAAAAARKAGLMVVMDACMKTEAIRLEMKNTC